MLRRGKSIFSWITRADAKALLQYDIASMLLSTPRLILPPELRQHLLEQLSRCAERFLRKNGGRNEFLHHLLRVRLYVRIIASPRRLRFFAAFTRGKAHFFAKAFPFALKKICDGWRNNVGAFPFKLPTLMEAFKNMLASEKLLGLAGEADQLIVRIFSFSFHKGLPKKMSRGPGGGFVFRRAVASRNPGREESFKTLTGRDPAGNRLPEPTGKRAPVF